MRFDKQYYDDIWGENGVHRHEYCESLADQLIAKYGKCKVLDIGSGCGYLVKVLRDKGCEAYGVDVSEYAASNSHGNVLLGDVRDLPFKDNSFDLVFSQGLWEYIPEADIEKAYSECLRVGKHQVHNIDPVGSGAGEEDFITAKPLEWWEKKLQPPKILIACSTFDGKKDCFNQWYEAYQKLDYPNKELLMIDNSDGNNYANFLREKGVNAVHLDIEGTNNYKITQSNEYIRKYFLAGGYHKWFNLESDVLVPPETLHLLLQHDADWVGCNYRSRDGTHCVSEWGCSLFSRKIMEETSFVGAAQDDTIDGYWWRTQVEPKAKYTIVNLYDFLDIKHL